MSSRKVKADVLALLAGSDLKMLQEKLLAMDVRDVLHALFSGICRSEEHQRWHAIACMGPAVARLAAEDMEAARVIMRRLLWSLNDESGGIGWGAPEAMAEIMVWHRDLADEYLHMLVSYMREDGEELFQDGNYLEHEDLQRGLMWGIARLAATRPAMLLERGVTKDLIAYLQSPDPGVRGLAARSLGLLGARSAVPRLQELQDDKGLVRLFANGELRTVSVGELVAEALENLTVREVQ